MNPTSAARRHAELAELCSLALVLLLLGLVSWDMTTITSAAANHTLVQSSMDVPLDRWDQTVAWFIQNYAGVCVWGGISI